MPYRQADTRFCCESSCGRAFLFRFWGTFAVCRCGGGNICAGLEKNEFAPYKSKLKYCTICPVCLLRWFCTLTSPVNRSYMSQWAIIANLLVRTPHTGAFAQVVISTNEPVGTRATIANCPWRHATPARSLRLFLLRPSGLRSRSDRREYGSAGTAP